MPLSLATSSGFGSSIRPNLPCGAITSAIVSKCWSDCGDAEDVVDEAVADRLQLLGHRLRMIDHVMRAELPAPGLRLRPRRGRDHGELGRACARAGSQIEPTPPAPPTISSDLPSPPPRGIAEAVEQHFPCGDRGERQRGRRREVERLRLAPDDALVDQMEFAVGAGPDDRARVPDLVARLEQRHVRPDRRDDAGRVVAENLGGSPSFGSARLRTL